MSTGVNSRDMATLIKADLERMIDDLYNKMDKVHRKHNEDIGKQRRERVKAYVATKSIDFQHFYDSMKWLNHVENYIMDDKPTLYDGIDDEIDQGSELRRIILLKVKLINRKNKSYEEVLEEVKKKLVEHYNLQ